MTIEERLNLLAEARDFYADLSDVGGLNELLWHRKAAALNTVIEGLDFYKRTALFKEERTEENLKEAMEVVIDEDKVNEMIEKFEMNDLEAGFYEGGFGLAIGILQENEEAIEGLKKLQEEFEKISKKKKSIADLIK